MPLLPELPLFLLLMAMALMVWLSSFTTLLSWEFLHINMFTFDVSTLSDYFSILFITTVLLISSLIYLFTKHYMASDPNLIYFTLLLFMFVMSMATLITSSSWPLFLLGWDGLGITSYYLVVFYSSITTSTSGMVVSLSNRTGDALLICLIILAMFYTSTYLIYYTIASTTLLQLLTMVSYTKSAQYPFSTWLPLAMAAPTPVSALVHSSTLVTAGLYLLIKYFVVITFNVTVSLLAISFMTCTLASVSASLSMDAKKMIALSTLSHLALMFSSYAMALVNLCLAHLLTHASFKASLFILSGYTLHSNTSNQDTRNLNTPTPSPHYTIMVGLCIMSMASLPMLSGFFTKDIIIEKAMTGMYSPLLVLLVCTTALLTMVYSFNILVSVSSTSTSPYSLSPMLLWSLLATLAIIAPAVLGGILADKYLCTITPISPSFIYKVALLFMLLTAIMVVALSVLLTHASFKAIMNLIPMSRPSMLQMGVNTLAYSKASLSSTDNGWNETLIYYTIASTTLLTYGVISLNLTSKEMDTFHYSLYGLLVLLMMSC